MFEFFYKDFSAAVSSLVICDATLLILFMALISVIVPFVVRPFGKYRG